MNAYPIYGAQLTSGSFTERLARTFARNVPEGWEADDPTAAEWLVMRLLAEDLARYDAGCWIGDLSEPAPLIDLESEHADGVELSVHVLPGGHLGVGVPGTAAVLLQWTGTVRAARTAMVIHGYLWRLHELGFALWDGRLRQPVAPTGPDRWLLVGAASAEDPPASPGIAPAMAVPAAAVPADAFDPMSQPITVDDLPDELSWRQLDVLADACSITARAPDDDPQNPALEIAVSAHRSHGLAEDPGADHPPRLVPAPPVGGTPAYWLDMPHEFHPYRTRTRTRLRWADGPGYTQVEVYGPDNGARELALRVAAGVRTGVAEPVRLPFTLGPLPGGLFPQMVRVEQGGSDRPWYVDLRIAHEPMRGRRSGPPRGVEIRCYPCTELSDGRQTPDRFIDGRPARYKQNPAIDDGGGSEELTVFDVEGHYLRILALGDKARSAIGLAGVLGLYRRLCFTFDDWTASPFAPPSSTSRSPTPRSRASPSRPH